MRSVSRAFGVLGAVAVAWPLAGPAAEPAVGDQAGFDPTYSVATVPPGRDGAARGDLRCSYYRNLVVRESAADTASPAGASLLPSPPGRRTPACAATEVPGEIALDTAGFGLTGRKGDFLVFTATDAKGAVPFKAINVTSGRPVFGDALLAGTGFASVQADAAELRLRYRRAVAAPCSIALNGPQSGPACWAMLQATGQIFGGMTDLPAPVDTCVAGYRSNSAAPAHPSLLSYDVEMAIKSSGSYRVVSRGALACQALP